MIVVRGNVFRVLIERWVLLESFYIEGKFGSDGLEKVVDVDVGNIVFKE